MGYIKAKNIYRPINGSVNKLVINLIVFLSLLFQFLHGITGQIIFNAMFMLAGMSLLVFHLKPSKQAFFIISFLLLFQVFSSLFSEREITSQYLFLVSSFILGCSIGKYGQIKYATLLYFALIASYFVYKILIGANLNEDVFSSMSRNFISVYIIWACSLLCLTSFRADIKIICAVVTLLICIFAAGRSGIVSSLFLLIVLLYDYRSKMKYFLYAILLIVCIYYHNVIQDVVDVFFYRFQSQGLSDEGRAQILHCYASNFDIFKLIFGIDYGGDNSCGTLAIGVYNLHNSFLSLLSFTGLGALIVLLLIVYILLQCVKNKLYLEMAVIVSILLRSISDTVLFFSSWDYLFWLILYRVHAKNEYILCNNSDSSFKSYNSSLK